MIISRKKYEHDIEMAVEKAKQEMWDEFHTRQNLERQEREICELRKRLYTLEHPDEVQCKCRNECAFPVI